MSQSNHRFHPSFFVWRTSCVMRLGAVSLACAISIASAERSAVAADATWSGITYNGLTWVTGGNWSGGVMAGGTTGTTSTDIATFDNVGVQTITLPTGLNVGGITFATTGTTANPFYLSGGTLLTSANAIIQTASSYRSIADINTAPTLQGNLTLRSNGQAGSGLFLAGAMTTAASLGNVTLTLDGSNTGYNSQLNNIVSGVISQGASSTLAVRKTGAGSWYLSAANTYTGGTQLDGGLLVTGNAQALGTSGTISVQSNSTLRTVTAPGDISSRLSIADSGTLTFDTWGNNQTWLGVVSTSGASNTAGVTKTGLGQLSIGGTATPPGTQTWRGDTTINMGTLFIDGTASTSGITNVIDPNSRLVLGGGIMYFRGKVGFASSQTFNGTVVNGGVSEVRPASGSGANAIALGSITRNTGGLLSILSSSSFSYTTTSTNDATGALKGVLFAVNDFARSNSGTIAAATATTQNAAGAWTSASAIYVTGAAVTGTVGTGGTTDIGGLKLNFGGSQSFSINGTLRTSAGIIFSSAISSQNSEISGGSLTSTSGDLIIVNNNVQNTYGRSTVSSTIVDNGSPTNVIFYNAANASTLYISGNNTYTGDTYVGGNNNAGSGSSVTLIGGTAGASIGSAGKTVFVNGGSGGNSNILRVGNGDATGNVKGTIRLENGRLSLNRSDTFTLSATVGGTAGGGYISQDGTGNATLNLASGANLFRTLTNNSTGTLSLQGSGVYVFDYANSNAASTTNFASGAFYIGGAGNTSTNTIGTWIVAGATLTLADGRYFNSGGGTVNLTSGTIKTNGNAAGGFSQTSGTITYNVSGGHFIAAVNSTTGFAASLAIGNQATATGPTTFTQTGGEVTVGLPDNATVSSQSSKQLAIGTGSSQHASLYSLSGGVLRSFGGISVLSNTQPLLTGGTNTFGWTGGRLTIASYDGTLLTSSNGVNSGTGTLFQGGATSAMAPGEVFNGVQYTGRTSITGNYQIDSGVLAIGVGGTTAAAQFHNTSVDSYDNLSVTGATTLGGRLAVSLLNGYAPPADTTTKFNIVVGTTAGATGQFTNQMTASSGNARIVLADGISSLIVATNTTGATATTGGLSSVAARTTALGGYKITNVYSGANNASWDAANAGSWQNFDPGSTPSPATQASNAIAVFADASSSTGTIAVGLGSTRNISGIQFSSTTTRSYTIAGAGQLVIDNTLAGGAASITDASSVGSAVNVPITLLSDLAASVTGSSATLTLGSNISGAGRSLSKTGAGMLVLSGSNSYTGTTTISAGGVTIGSTDSLPGWNTSGRFSVANGATLAVGNGVGDSSLATILGTANFAAGSQLGFDTTAGNRTISTALTDTASGSLGLVKIGTNSLILTAANTYSGATQIQGGQLQIGDGGTTGSLGNAAVTNNATLVFNRSDVVSFANSLAGTGGVTQANAAGTLVLSGNKSHSGGVLVARGQVNGTGAGSFGSGTVTLADATTLTDNVGLMLDAAGSTSIANAIVVSALGTGTVAIGGLNTGDAAVNTWAGNVSLGRSVNLVAATTTALSTFSGTLSGAGGITVTQGRVSVSNPGNSFSGAVAVKAGAILQLDANEVLPSAGGLTLNGTLSLASGGGAETIGTLTGTGVVQAATAGTYTLTAGGTATSTFGGSIIDNAGTVAYTKVGSGTQVLTGANTFSGTTTIAAGRLTLGNGGTTGSLAGPIANAGSLAFNRSDAFAFASAVSGTGSILQLGNGAVTISGVNTYTGMTQVGVSTAETGTGSIFVQGDQSAANGGWQIGTSSTVSRTVTFDVGSTVAIAAGRSLMLGGTTSNSTQAAQNLVMMGSGTAAGSLAAGRGGNLSMESGATWTQNGPFAINAYGGVLPPTMTIKTGATLTYGGSTTIQVNGASNSSANATLALAGGTLVTGRGFEQTTGTAAGYGRVLLSGTGTIRLSDNVAALSTGSNAPVRFELGAGGGRIDTNGFNSTLAVGITGAGGLRKAGLGSLILSGSSSYSGATAVDAGRLVVNGALGNSAVTVAAGASLGGSGSIGGQTTVDGLYAPGNSPGLLTQAGGLTLNASSTTVWELWANTDSAADRGTLYDAINLTGGALSILSGATLQLDFGTAGTSTVDWNDPFWDVAHTWTLVDVSGSGSWNGDLFSTLLVGMDSTGASLASKRNDAGFSVKASGGDLLIEYVIVPEPGVIVLAISGLVLAGVARARRLAGG